ncbi:MAG TPA: YidB family protein [bacterium]|jgi:uncharacterized protein YidB (DUF937 family)
MSILDKLSEKAGDLFGAHGGVAESVLGMIKSKAGGLGDLVEQFKSKGLGETVSSWVGTGENKPISPAQVTQALGKDQVEGIATKLGISTDEAAAKLSEVLPKVVDKLTPTGSVADAAK